MIVTQFPLSVPSLLPSLCLCPAPSLSCLLKTFCNSSTTTTQMVSTSIEMVAQDGDHKQSGAQIYILLQKNVYFE